MVAYALKALPTAQTSLYYRIRFKLRNSLTGSTSLYLERFRTGTTGGTQLLGVYVNSTTHRLGSSPGITSSTVVSMDAWHTLQVHVTVADTSSQVETWLDGTPVTELTGTQSLGTSPITRIQLGDTTANKIYDVLYDDVAADTAFIP